MKGHFFGKGPDPDKQRIRERVWRIMEEKGVSRFPGAFGRIPNFVGAEKAALLASQLEVFKRAKVIKANPDSPQRKLREIALRSGKTVYMAVPRLKEERCFVELLPERIGGSFAEASTIKGAFKYGRKVYPWEMKKVDLVIAGSVAVNLKGQRIGKGGGFSDLEFAIGRKFGLITENTPVLTTVHSIQVLEEDFPFYEHDIPVDLVVTEKDVFSLEHSLPRPSGILWELLSEKQIESIPLLKKLKRGEVP